MSFLEFAHIREAWEPRVYVKGERLAKEGHDLKELMLITDGKASISALKEEIMYIQQGICCIMCFTG